MHTSSSRTTPAASAEGAADDEWGPFLDVVGGLAYRLVPDQMGGFLVTPLRGHVPDGPEAEPPWPLALLVHPDDQAWVYPKVSHLLKAPPDAPLRLIARMHSAGGPPRWLEHRLGPDPEAPQKALVGVVYDVTDQRRAQEELEERQYQLQRQMRRAEDAARTSQAFLEAIPDSLYLLSEGGRFAGLVKPGALGVPGSRAPAVGATLEEVFPASLAAEVRDRLATTLATGGTQRLNHTMAAEGHAVRHFELRLSVIQGTSQVLLMSREVTVEHEVQLALQYQASLLSGISDAIVATDQDLRITSWNEAAEVMYGWPRTDVLGRWLPDVISFISKDVDTDGQEREDALRELHQQGRWRGRIQQAHRAGRQLQVLASLTTLRASDGTLTGYVGVYRDLTLLLTALQEVQTLNQELEARVDDRTRALASANKELTDFAHVVAHDIRAPLRAINNYAQFLQEDLAGRLDHEETRLLDGMRKATAEADAFVQDLLAFAQVGRVSQDPHPIALRSLLQSVIHVLGLRPEVDVRLQPGPWPALVAEEVLIRQILQNLINNAAKFTPEPDKGIEVAWTIEADTDQLTLSVKDRGIGIHTLNQQRIFGIFERLHPRGTYEGTGVGLAIVKKAATQLNGSVRLESSVGMGSTFFVTIPLRPAGATR
ncbi:MAG: ATP-binding protein [Bacteroidota bacterium]